MPQFKKIVELDSKTLTVMIAILVGISGFANAVCPSIIGTPEFTTSINDKNIRAMRWLKDNTLKNSTIIVIGEGEAWVPHFSKRKCCGSHCGSRWMSNLKALHFSTNLHHADSASKLENLLKKYNISASYIYISSFSSRPRMLSRMTTLSNLWRSLIYSQNFKSVFKNNRAQIFEVKNL